MRSHPSLPGLLSLVDKKRLESFQRATETTLSVLNEAGFPVSRQYWVASYLLMGCLALVQHKPAHLNLGESEQSEQRRLERLALEALPADRFPCTIAYARTLEEPVDPEEFFSFGTDLLIAGVRAMAPTP